MTDEQSVDRAHIEYEITRAVARLKAVVLGMVIGLIAGVGLFAMTAVLIIDGGPDAGIHLQLLGNFFPGYSVTWPGAVIGFFWAFVCGGVIGFAIGRVYNRVVDIRQR